MKPHHRALSVLIVYSVLMLGFLLQEEVSERLEKWLPDKFSIAHGLLTATPLYSVSGDTLEPPPSAESQQEGLPPLNMSRLPFKIDDTELLAALRGTQACVPKNFGYSVSAGNTLFPPYEYPSCESKLPRDLPILHTNEELTSFSLSCPNGHKGKFVLSPADLYPNGLYTPVDLENKWQTEHFRGEEMPLGNSEFVFASCEDTFTQMRHMPRFNKTAYARVSARMREFESKEKPLTLILLTVDSFSRRHFFRKLNKTVEFLNELNSDEDYALFDFKLHNVKGGSSVENMVPLFGNRSFVELSRPPFRDLIGPGALWQMLRELGYVTLLGLESCDYHFPGCLGKRVEVDHVMRTFFCGANKLLHVTNVKESTEQRCIGPHMSHYYMLNYTNAFLRLYKGVNQFISFHVDTAHEATGQHAVTLDGDLRDFLKSYIQVTADIGHDLVIFLQADHGMRYGNWYKDVAAYQELKLPAFFLITTSDLLARIPYARETLWNNTFRLTSKLDIRSSILGLSMLPYNRTYPMHGDPYLSTSVDLFREEVNSSRTCEEAGIDPWYCGCLLFERIDTTACSSDLDSLGRLIYRVAEVALAVVNRETNTSPVLPEGLLCQKLTLGYVRKSYGLRLESGLEMLQVEFSVKELTSARFETLVIVGTTSDSELMRLSKERYELLPFVYNGYQVRIRLIGVTRKDKYAGECEVVASANGVRAEFCVCTDLDELRRRAPTLFSPAQ